MGQLRENTKLGATKQNKIRNKWIHSVKIKSLNSEWIKESGKKSSSRIEARQNTCFRVLIETIGVHGWGVINTHLKKSMM